MTYEPTDSEFTIDPRGFLIERTTIAGEEVLIHYRDIPESDITTLHGIRLTTPLRTVIDLASDVDNDHLGLMVRDCLDRGLFTIDEALLRTAQPDMHDDPGAQALRAFLTQP